jgi:hypothetical protein
MNPYEDDLHDLSVMKYISEGIAASRKVVSGEGRPPTSAEVEQILEKARSIKGRGFVNGIDM